MGMPADRNGRPCYLPVVAAALGLAAFFLTSHATLSYAQTMALPGSFSVGASGAASYSIPIAVPPGTAGVAPSLTLEYNSQGGNGLLGVGWSLGGLPSIGRCARTLAQDSAVGGVNYDGNDRFCFEGQRLISISGIYGADGAEYRTEVESFTRVISHGTVGTGPAWFEVHTKSGQVMEFGHTADSLILAQGKATARNWALSKLSDTKGNYFTASYTNDATNGQFYPIEIDYTGNVAASVSPANKVQFVYASRPDIIPQYQAGSLTQTTVRLTDVKTLAGATLVADYKLAYQQSGPSNRSRIVSVTVCEGGGTCLPATTANWTKPSVGFGAQQQWSPNYGLSNGWTDNNTYPRMLVDVNGDGLPDVVGFGGAGVFVSLNTGTGFGAQQQWSATFVAATGWTNNNTYPRMLVDVNGDGLPDVVGFGGAGVFVSLNTGTGFGAQQQWSATFATVTGWTDNNTYPRMLVDVNGDGLPDVVGFGGAGVFVSLNTGTGFGAQQQWSATFATATGWTNNNTYPRMLVDVNGDGLPDVVGFGGAGVFVSLNTGTGFGAQQQWSATFATATGWTDNNTYPRMLVDVNGDGLPDVVGFGGAGVFVSLNTGTGFGAQQQWSPTYDLSNGWTDNNTYPRMLVDVNGDGLPDVVGFGGAGVFVSLNTGTGFGAQQQWSPTYDLSNGWTDNNTYPRMLVDVNGTGFAGIVGFGSSGVYVSSNTAGGPPTDIVSSVTNGFGVTTTINYAPATNKSVVSKGIGTTFPTLDLSGPMYVVSQVNSSNGVGGTYSSSYAYSGGRLDTRGRGFLGFQQTRIKDLQTNVVETTTYRQDFPYIGLAASTAKSFNALTLNQTTSSYQVSNASGASSVSAPSGTGAPYKVSVAQSVAQSSDLDGTALPAVTTTYQYDAFGNPTQVVASTPDGLSKTTANTYTNDATHWLLGRLTRASVTSVTP